MTREGAGRPINRRNFIVGAGASAALLSTTQAWPAYAAGSAGASDPVPVGAAPPAGRVWDLVLNEEWASINTSLWYRYWNTFGASLNTEDYLRPRNLVVSDGTLKVVTKRESYEGPDGPRDFTSGFISTGKRGLSETPQPAADVFFPREAFFEMRGKVVHAQGILNAFWLRHRAGASEAEVDIMETFHDQIPGKTSQTLHLDISGTLITNIFKRNTFIESTSATPSWHTWGVSISESGVDVLFTFYTDGIWNGKLHCPES